ncbi:hypothetical protein DENSPDRAFT_434947 [Dentipellis sp. KUC8613]|nr:hypothetical protein DENSPDRAFT_434947 [Dentipellis sp. KUC8613]
MICVIYAVLCKFVYVHVPEYALFDEYEYERVGCDEDVGWAGLSWVRESGPGFGACRSASKPDAVGISPQTTDSAQGPSSTPHRHGTCILPPIAAPRLNSHGTRMHQEHMHM